VSFRILRDWAAQHRYGNVTTAQFITLAKRDSGRNLQYLFDVWLYQPTSQRPGRAFGCSEPAITDVQPAASTSPGAGRPPTDDQNEAINPGNRHGALVDRHERSEIPPPIEMGDHLGSSQLVQRDPVAAWSSK
jgi:hypothetical protein